MINFQAIKAVLNNINLYYYWNIIETVLAIIVCLIQVSFISKVCKTETIVWSLWLDKKMYILMGISSFNDFYLCFFLPFYISDTIKKPLN